MDSRSVESPEQLRQRMLGQSPADAPKATRERTLADSLRPGVRQVQVSPGTAFQFGLFCAIGWSLGSIPIVVVIYLMVRLLTK